MNSSKVHIVRSEEIDSWGQKITWTRMIEISECAYIAGGFNQTERLYRNNVIVQNGSYPACSDYGKQRREKFGWMDWQ